MRRPRLTTRRIIVLVGVLIVALGQVVSLAYQRYLRCQSLADEHALSEGVHRQKAATCEELAPKLRDVATLAREMAKSASSDFERSKWLEMARVEEEKAIKLDQEAIREMTMADKFASRANAMSRLAWSPWLSEPD
jgi:hypothetical protein